MDEGTLNETSMPEYIAPEYVDIETAEGRLRIIFEMDVGDLLVITFLSLLLLYLILNSVMKIVWSRR